MLASDGVWEFITSSEAVEIAAGAMMAATATPAAPPTGVGAELSAAGAMSAGPSAAAAAGKKELSAAAACQALVEQAARRWRHFEVGA